jgi:hypothetical protein
LERGEEQAETRDLRLERGDSMKEMDEGLGRRILDLDEDLDLLADEQMEIVVLGRALIQDGVFGLVDSALDDLNTIFGLFRTGRREGKEDGSA